MDIIAALLMSVAGIAGILFFARRTVTLERCILTIEDCFDQLSAHSDETDKALREALAAAPHYGRDPKTSRFSKKAA